MPFSVPFQLCLLRALWGWLSESVWFFSLVFKLCPSIAQCVRAAPSGKAQQQQRQLLKAWAGSRAPSQSLEEEVCANRPGGGQGQPGCELQHLRRWQGVGRGVQECSSGCSHLPATPTDGAGRLVARSGFLGMQTWGAEHNSAERERVGKRSEKSSAKTGSPQNERQRVGVSSRLIFAFLIWGLCVLYSERLKNLIIPKHLY